MKIGIMGGTLDPVHCGHIEIARKVKQALGLDGMLLLPAGDPPHKRRWANKLDRMEMARLAAKSAGFEACSAEIEREGTTYTVETLRAFHRERPGVEWVYIVGADTLNVLDSWRDFAEVAALCEFAAVGRPGVSRKVAADRAAELKMLYGARISLVDADGPELSSTEIRARVAQGQSIAGSVPRAVEDYICQKGLYLSGMDEQAMLEKLKGEITPKRYAHTLGVAQVAERLAERFGVQPARARLAGILHDCAKSMSMEDMHRLIAQAGIDVDELEWNNHFVLHAPAGAALAATEYGVRDARILSAIRWHTLGGPQMTALEALIYVADCVEPGRNPYPGLEEARALSERDIFAAARLCAERSVDYVRSWGNTPHPRTLEMLK